jgi:hypothetical protein
MKCKKKLLLGCFVFLSILAVALPAVAENVQANIGGPWMEFAFGAEDTLAFTGVGTTPSSGGNSVQVGDPAWTFTLSGPGLLKITDAFEVGDTFEVRDFGVAILNTPVVPAVSTSFTDDPAVAFGNVTFNYSYGSISLAAGPHSIEIEAEESPFDGGAAYFRVDAGPEPMTLLLLGFGLLGVAGARRFKKDV